MTRILKGGSTFKQMAYARRVFSAQGKDRKHIALDVGYSPSVANDIIAKLESKKGFNNAMAKLAGESNMLALQIMHEFKSRGVNDFSNKDLVGALNAIGSAWSKFNGGLQSDLKANQTKLGNNKLRTVILQQIENQTISVPNEEVEEVDLDF